MEQIDYNITQHILKSEVEKFKTTFVLQQIKEEQIKQLKTGF